MSKTECHSRVCTDDDKVSQSLTKHKINKVDGKESNQKRIGVSKWAQWVGGEGGD